MAIESDADLDGLMIDSGETLTHSGTDYTVLAAETDGETLDGGRDVDGGYDVLMKLSDITASAMAEGDSVTFDGSTYIIGKIDDISQSLSVLYLEP